MPARIGDIVVYEERTWLIAKRDTSTRTAVLKDWEGLTVEVADDPGESFRIVARPQRQWPFIAAPIKSKGGRVVKIVRSGVELEPLVEWVPSSRDRPGGSIFFNPALGLRLGEVLVAHHEKGELLSRIGVTRAFGTVRRRQRIAASQRPRETPRTAAERLMSDDNLYEDFDEL